MRWIAYLWVVGFVAGGAAIPTVARAEPRTWDFGGGGKWPLVEGASTRPAAPNATLDRAERLLEAHRGGEAEGLVTGWVRNPSNAKAVDRDRAIFLLADAYYQDDDWIKAFYQLDELVEKYPESRFYYPALEKQFQIADGFLNGHKRRFLGIPFLGATDEAVDMLYRIQERAPGSPLAERALLRTADFYFDDSEFELAGDAYAAYVRGYPRSPEVPRVRLRQAFSSYAQFRGVKFDATPLIDARAQFEDIRTRYPELASEVNVQKFIDRINETLARKLFYTADFYRRTDRPRAAAYTFRQLLATYPTSAEADQARSELQKLPRWAVEEPVPASTRPLDENALTRPAIPQLGPRITPPRSPPEVGPGNQ